MQDQAAPHRQPSERGHDNDENHRAAAYPQHTPVAPVHARNLHIQVAREVRRHAERQPRRAANHRNRKPRPERPCDDGRKVRVQENGQRLRGVDHHAGRPHARADPHPHEPKRRDQNGRNQAARARRAFVARREDRLYVDLRAEHPDEKRHARADIHPHAALEDPEPRPRREVARERFGRKSQGYDFRRAEDEQEIQQERLRVADDAEALEPAREDEREDHDGQGRRRDLLRHREDRLKQRRARDELRDDREQRPERRADERQKRRRRAVAPFDELRQRHEPRPPERTREPQPQNEAPDAAPEREPPARQAVEIRHLHRPDRRTARDERPHDDPRDRERSGLATGHLVGVRAFDRSRRRRPDRAERNDHGERREHERRRHGTAFGENTAGNIT